MPLTPLPPVFYRVLPDYFFHLRSISLSPRNSRLFRYVLPSRGYYCTFRVISTVTHVIGVRSHVYAILFDSSVPQRSNVKLSSPYLCRGPILWP